MTPIPTYTEGALCTGPASWPDADLIVGNPPFLGSKLFRQHGLPEPYIQAMYAKFDLPNSSDLVCYWFELARQVIEKTPHVRAGLLATQGIRGGDNRRVLERIKDTGDIFMAWSDKEWVLDGAAVHVSIVGFAGEQAHKATLDGVHIAEINPSLRNGPDLTLAVALHENADIAFMGITPSGKFDIDNEQARQFLSLPNSNGRSSLDVVRPWMNANDVTSRTRAAWIIDLSEHKEESKASGFDSVFEYVARVIAKGRAEYRTGKKAYWLFERSRPAMRTALDGLNRYVMTPMTSKHCMFCWASIVSLPANLIIAFARSDDYFLGVLHSSVHELWARRMGTQLREAESGFRYTPTTCFETFPLPWSPGKEPAPGTNALYDAIAQAAKDLNDQRENWLNPPQWIDAIARQIDAQDNFSDVASVSGEEARRLIRESAIMAAAAKDPKLKKRTLTNLYNERPTWLRLAHRRLDEAVLAAYASVDPAPGGGGWQTSWAQVWEETGAGQPLPDNHALSAKRKEVDESVLAALLALNLQRAGNG